MVKPPHQLLMFAGFMVSYLIIYTGKCTCGDVNNKIIKIPLKKAINVIVEKDYNDRNVTNLRDIKLNKRSVSNIEKRVSFSDSNDVTLRGTLSNGYYMEILIGTPAQSLDVLIDTGSSNFAVAAAPQPSVEKFFDPTRSSTLSANDGESFTVPYVQGEWTGHPGRDVVRIPPFVEVTIETNVGLITRSSNFFVAGTEWQGIAGLAYQHLSIHSSPGQKTTFWDDIVRAMNVPDVFSLSLCESQGSMTIGGVDSERFKGDVHYVPLNREWYYDVLVMDVLIGGITLGLDCKEYNFDKAIIDSGTTYLHFPPTVFNRLVDLLVRYTQHEFPEFFWQGVSTVCYDYDTFPWEALPNITLSFFAMSSSLATTYNVVNLVINPRLYMREVYAFSDGWLPDKSCYRFSITKSSGGTIIGAVIMEGFYTVFDKQNKSIGFAISSCVPSGWSDVLTSSINGDYNGCAYNALKIDQNLIMIFIAICVVLCSVFFLCFTYCVVKIEFYNKHLTSGETKSNENIAVLKQ